MICAHCLSFSLARVLTFWPSPRAVFSCFSRAKCWRWRISRAAWQRRESCSAARDLPKKPLRLDADVPRSTHERSECLLPSRCFVMSNVEAACASEVFSSTRRPSVATRAGPFQERPPALSS